MKTNLMKKLTVTALAMGMLAGCGQSDGANTGNTDGTGQGQSCSLPEPALSGSVYGNKDSEALSLLRLIHPGVLS